VYRFCRSLLATGRAPEAEFADALELLGEQGLVELVCVVGYYTLVAFVVNADRHPLPAGAAGLPASG
jgi:4-carboxymuconolactone decarboxylase